MCTAPGLKVEKAAAYFSVGEDNDHRRFAPMVVVLNDGKKLNLQILIELCAFVFDDAPKVSTNRFFPQKWPSGSKNGDRIMLK
jgi:hypothetical protein